MDVFCRHYREKIVEQERDKYVVMDVITFDEECNEHTDRYVADKAHLYTHHIEALKSNEKDTRTIRLTLQVFLMSCFDRVDPSSPLYDAYKRAAHLYVYKYLKSYFNPAF
jgi:hypothetical protein